MVDLTTRSRQTGPDLTDSRHDDAIWTANPSLDLRMAAHRDHDEDPVKAEVEDDLQDLVGTVRKRRDRRDEDEELDFSMGGKLPPDHPDADIFDDLDL